jgi:hypothetical protein
MTKSDYFADWFEKHQTIFYEEMQKSVGNPRITDMLDVASVLEETVDDIPEEHVHQIAMFAGMLFLAMDTGGLDPSLVAIIFLNVSRYALTLYLLGRGTKEDIPDVFRKAFE